ncbi:tetratricopeptide repeat protein [Nonomuraea sp. KC401]|uniref:ATP-binding protein n=1 Tax=unclassified Nonomuraea TaxID=2593643 RepID=UPI0010FD0BA7|nr:MULTISPECIES: LuxR C-terminal-related transcriptional regulator [unclassified Nonomuraea]NBE92154.1 tetratricopeptide repeat protein [Nonomuraea sp. K271]TLF85651.1 tetratricopeptide repeat protein [Nonomuraea sp. KC401]
MVPKRTEGNLPLELSSFVGRRHELAEARRLMTQTRMLTLTGAGGVGKTRLALRLAADARRAFRDGVWLVDLAPLHDAESLAPAVVDALGFRDESPRRPDSGLVELLESRQLLLVLDNCEHMPLPVAVLAGKLLGAAPELRILATSRETLGVEGECVFTVPPLTLPLPGQSADLSEAVTLFAERAAAVQPGFTLGDDGERVAELCRRLDGLPLAIELAAARLRVLPVAEILDRMDDRFRLLADRRQTAVPRHRTLRAAIDWSYDLCEPAERVLWARLSVFPGEFGLESAEQVCSSDEIAPDEVFDLLGGLLDKSILTRTERAGRARYRLLDNIREYGQDILAGFGEEPALRRRHRDHYLSLARRARQEWFGPDQAEWVTRLQCDQDGIRAALEFSLGEPGEAPAALEIVSSLWNYWLFTAGSFGEGRRRLARALELAPEASPIRADALWVAAWFALRQGDVDAAKPLLSESRDLAQRLDLPAALASVTHFSGLAAHLEGEHQEALALLSEARERYLAASDQAGVWMTLFHLVIVYSASGDTDQAAAYAAECLAMCEGRSAYLSRSNALWVAGLAHWFQGAQDQAAALVKKGLDVMRRHDDRWGVAESLEVLAWIEAAHGREERAATLFGAACATWRSIGTATPGLRSFTDFHNLCETRVRDALGGDAYLSVFRRGAGLSLDEAVDHALDVDRSPPAQRRRPSVLTPREQEVAELVAQGLSNKEIAARLVIAQRTAEGHVEHIMTKLSLSSRVQIATWFTTHGRSHSRNPPGR